MTAITEADIQRAARLVANRLNRFIEFQIPESDPRYMEVTQVDRVRESKLRGSGGKSAPAASERYGL